jgi:putative transposase
VQPERLVEYVRQEEAEEDGQARDTGLFHRALLRHGMVGSMGQVGSAADNAATESFFALLQHNVRDRRRWATRDELRIAIITWIKHTYHRRRRQAVLDRLTPVEYEAIMTAPASQAA